MSTTKSTATKRKPTPKTGPSATSPAVTVTKSTTCLGLFGATPAVQ